jgi:hypothetical protein
LIAFVTMLVYHFTFLSSIRLVGNILILRVHNGT